MNLVLRKLKMLEKSIIAEELSARKNFSELSQTKLNLKNNVNKILTTVEMV